MKKNYTYQDLKDFKVERHSRIDTYGTCASGYVRRDGLLINGHPYQVVYSSKGYGRITSDIKFYNERYHSKYKCYDKKCDEYFDKYIGGYIK